MRVPACKRGPLTICLATALLFAAEPVVWCQTAARGAIAGKLTDLYSRPLEGVRLTMHNETSHIQAQTTTGKNGAYRLNELPPGEYVVEALSPLQGHARLQGIMITAGYEAHVRLSLNFDGKPLSLLEQAQARPPAAQPTSSTPPSNNVTSLDLENSAWIQGRAPSETQPAQLILDSRAAPEITHAADRPRQSMATPLVPHSAGLPGASNSPLSAFENAPSNADPQIASMAETGLPAQPVLALSARSDLAVLSSVAASLPRQSGRALAWVASSAAQAALQMQTATSTQNRLAAMLPDPVQQSLATTVSGEQLQQLPIAGRDWMQIALDANTQLPKLPESPSQTESLVPADPDVVVDGVSTRSAFSHSSSAGLGNAQVDVGLQNETAIQEMKSSSVLAAPDLASGGSNAIRIETHPGTNSLHGQAFLIDRQDVLAARNPFTSWVRETAPAALLTSPSFSSLPYAPSDRQWNWGMGVGGALHRQRLFWFAAFDGSRRNNPAVSMVRHPEEFFSQPSNDEMQVLSARLGTASSNPVAAGLAPYSSELEALAALLGPAARRSMQNFRFGRMDWNATERHRFTLEANGSGTTATGGGSTRSAQYYGNRSLGEIQATDFWIMGRWEAFLTPNLLASTQGSVGRHVLQKSPAKPSGLEQQLNASTWGQLPQMVIDPRYGFTIGNPAWFGNGTAPDERVFQAQETMDWVHGALLLNAAASLQHHADATSMLRNQGGTYHYARLENFISDAVVFTRFGMADALDPIHQMNCDERGQAWRDSAGQLHGRGYLPCYSYYTQTLGPNLWHLSTNDGAAFVTAQWQPSRKFVLSAALRWERQFLPPPVALVNNPDLPLTQNLPALGNQWGPRVAWAWGSRESPWPSLSMGYGVYFSRTRNAVLQTALTHTGSLKGDLNFFMRPTDNLAQEGGGAPPFPYVWSGQPARNEKPGVVAFEPGFRNGEVHQAIASIEQSLPGRIKVTASMALSLARHLPMTMDTNIDPSVNPRTITYAVRDASGKGPIKTPQLTVPFYASSIRLGESGRMHANYQQITDLFSQANSTYEAAILRLARTARNGINFRMRYLYAHAKDWNPDESDEVTGSSVLDPSHLSEEFGTSDLDVRHSLFATFTWESRSNFPSIAGWLTNGWRFSAIGQFHSGLPYTMRIEGAIPRQFTRDGIMILGLGPGINGYGGDNRGYGIGRNTYRYPSTWKADARISHRFALGHDRELEALAESFNLFNHQNITQIETTGYWIEPGAQSGTMPTLNFLTGLKSGQVEFGKPLGTNATDYYRPRQFDFGMRLRF